MKNVYESTFDSILKSVDFIKKVDNDKELSNAYQDGYSTRQQKLRDKRITELLNLYVDGYRKKVNSNIWYKSLIVIFCICILLAFSVTFLILIFRFNNKSGIRSEDLVSLISVCITFLTLIVGVLKIITTYVFPVNEEEYITRIVEAIQKNDLENKKENIRTGSGISSKESKTIIEEITKL